ncbi:MAG: exosome complex RNA-binding protein Rrp4 [Candidatus Aenigmatarchaeota archaeon]
MIKGKIILPGEKVEIKKSSLTYEENGNVYSKVLCLLEEKDDKKKLTPLNGRYIPKVGDKVIGIIKEVESAGWIVDINSFNTAFLPLGEALYEFIDIFRTDISKYYDVGDIIYTKIINIVKNKIIHLSMKEKGLKKLAQGILIKVSPYKVPRIIGKKSSMLSLLKNKTNCEIVVGQNGYIWLRGENVDKAINAIKTIERYSHISGLTEMIQKML